MGRREPHRGSNGGYRAGSGDPVRLRIKLKLQIWLEPLGVHWIVTIPGYGRDEPTATLDALEWFGLWYPWAIKNTHVQTIRMIRGRMR